MFSLICVWINDWVNNREASDLRRYRAHYDVIVLLFIGTRESAVQKSDDKTDRIYQKNLETSGTGEPNHNNDQGWI